MNHREYLLDGCAALKLELSEDKANKLLNFVDLIQKWNKAYNLTAIKTKQEMITLHLLDSLTALPYLHGERILDVGTGAGLPGIPLAICLPETHFTLLDSNSKKTRFVQQAVIELKLANVAVVQSRTEDFTPDQGFDTVITRAFAELADIVAMTRHALTDKGLLLAMKSQCTAAELSGVTQPCRVIPVHIPGVAAERNLVCLYPNQEVNEH